MGNGNKVKYGLKNVHYAKATISQDGTATYDAPKPIPGSVNLSLDQQGSANKFRADNMDYWVGQGNNGYSGELEIAIIPDDFRTDILGEVETDGRYQEYADAKTTAFALLFQFEGDVYNVRHVMYNCTASRPSITGKTTDEEIEPQTDTLNLTATAVTDPGNHRPIVKDRCYETAEAYDTWFDAVTFASTVNQTTHTGQGGSTDPSGD